MSSSLPLSLLTIPPFLYFPKHLMESQGPRFWAQLRFLQACERLEIPQKLQPKFPFLIIPQEYEERYTTAEVFTIPPFNVLYETEGEWRQRTLTEFNKHLDKWAVIFMGQLKANVENGHFVPIKQIRGDVPLELRYDWAARHHCLKEGWKEMATDDHSAEKIRKISGPILIDLGLVKKKKRK